MAGGNGGTEERETNPLLDVIACKRGECVAVRWANRPEDGWPVDGFVVDSDAAGTIGKFFPPVTSIIDEFLAESEARRPPCSDYFDTAALNQLWRLRFHLRLVDPRTDPSLMDEAVTEVASFFANPHASDAALTYQLWRFEAPPALADLLANSDARDLVIAYYRQKAYEYLLLLALRFDFAVWLGLATELENPGDGHFTVTAVIDENEVSVRSGEGDLAACPPLEGPSDFSAEPTSAKARHPLFADFADWPPNALLWPKMPSGALVPTHSLIPRSDCKATALTWTMPVDENHLLHHNAVLVRLYRRATGQPEVRLSPDADIVTPPQAPHYVDAHDQEWPPLDGYYEYDIEGVNLFGEVSPRQTATITLQDDIAPPRPRARIIEQVGRTISAAGGTLSLDVELGWDAAEEFAGPDCAEFRFQTIWRPVSHTAVVVTGFTGSVFPDFASLTIQSLVATGTIEGGTLCVGGYDFPIVSASGGTPGAVQVRLPNGRRPVLTGTQTPALIIHDGTATGLQAPRETRVHKLTREPVCGARVESIELLNPPSGTDGFVRLHLDKNRISPGLPSEVSSIYVHPLRASFKCEQVDDYVFDLLTPADWETSGEFLALREWDRIWRQVGEQDAIDLLLDAPIVLFQRQVANFTVTAPASFVSGVLEVYVTAADDKQYVNSPAHPATSPALQNLKGNESSSTLLPLAVRSLAPPAQPGVPVYGAGPQQPWNQNQRVWAKSATTYSEDAVAAVKWSAAAGAARYEVWRVLEGALTGATASTTDAGLRTMAAAQPDAFQLRSDVQFGTAMDDAIPGRAPTRALYKVRAVSGAGVQGAFSEIIGPFHVPDVRAPATPNVLKVAPSPYSPGATPPVPDKTLAIEWTQPGDSTDVSFAVLVREAGTTQFATAGTVARNTAPGAGGVFRFLHQLTRRGTSYEFQVIPVREALDPIDPNGVTRRNIFGTPSAVHSARVLSAFPLPPPATFAAAYDAVANNVVLSWDNATAYRAIAIRRRQAVGYVFSEVAVIDGAEESFVDAPGSGTWVYELRVNDDMGAVRTGEVTVVVP